MSETSSNKKTKESEIGKNWVFTFHNPCNEEINNLKAITGNTCKYIIYGWELTTNREWHLQGYIELFKNQRTPGIKKILDPIHGKSSVVHVELSNAGRAINKVYCSKGLQSHDEYKTLGIQGPNYGKETNIYEQTFTEVNEGKGKRNDWHNLYKRIAEEPDFHTILKEYPEEAIKYSNGIQRAIDTVINQNSKDKLAAEMDNLRLYNWEIELLEELEQVPDKRKIIWYVDHLGHTGKSTFAKYLLSKGNCAYFTNAKSADISFAYKGENTVIFDFTRSVEGRINYEIIESIKNGVVFSGKYNSGLKVNATPHIVCFSNFDPELCKLSHDRWDLRPLSQDKCIYPEDGDASDDDTTTTPIITSTEEHAPAPATLTSPQMVKNESRGNTEHAACPRFNVSQEIDYRGLPITYVINNGIKYNFAGLPIDPNYEIETREDKKEFDAQTDYASAYSQNYMEFL